MRPLRPVVWCDVKTNAAPVAATILAAGLGRRLGHRPKAALEIGGFSLMERMVAALRGAGLASVSVVLGAYPETLAPLVERADARVLMHGHPDSTLVGSQRLALEDHLERHPDHDLLLVLADLPRLVAHDVHALLRAWRGRPACIQAQMPVVGGVRGHPVLLSASAVRQVLSTPPEAGIRDWLRGHPHLVKPMLATQRAYIDDLDTPEDLLALKELFAPQAVCWPEGWRGPTVVTGETAAIPSRPAPRSPATD